MLSLVLLTASAASATPSTTYWTPAVTDIQPFGVAHIGVDNYFTVFKENDEGAGAFPTDAGLTIGLLPFVALQMEAGVDIVEPTDNSVYFNAKIGTPENALFAHSPALNAGIFNAGTKKGVTDYNILYGLAGITIPYLGRIHGGVYAGNGEVLVDGGGNKANRGYMIAFDHGFWPVGSGTDRYNRFVLAADYASGDNAIGGGGVGLYWFFTKDISLLAGPVWFNDEALNGKWKITIQLDINVDIFGRS